MGERIKLLASGLQVAPVLWALQSNPHLWNENTARTQDPASPHHGLDDIWARFGAPEEYATPHAAKWYPGAKVLGVEAMCMDVMRAATGVELGGVLITRIPPGAACKPHVDDGWHAKRYEKYAVQIASAPGQRFCFKDDALETKPGDFFWFDNQHEHWVTNPTTYERITMVVCVRVEH